MCTMAINKQLNGIELSFEAMPAEAIRTSMKAAGFRWHRQKKVWYAKQTAERLKLAQKLSGDSGIQAQAAPATAPKALTNSYGVKVGDVFYDSWGYEQTNIDFYQVVALRGKTQIVLRPIHSTGHEIGFCSRIVKPMRDSFYELDKYKTRLVGRGEETITKTVKNFGTEENPQLSAGNLHMTNLDTEFNETSYY